VITPPGRLAPESAVGIDLGRAVVRVRPPVRHRDHAGLDQVQALEEPGELPGAAQVVGRRAALVVAALRLVERLIGVGAVIQRQVTARRQASQQAAHDRVGLLIGEVAHDPHQHERDRPGEVQQACGGAQDPGRVPQIGVEVLARTFRAAGQQRASVGEHQGVIVYVHDPALRRHLLGHLMGVIRGGQAGADVQELPDPRLDGQVADRPGQERPGRAGDHGDTGKDLQVLIARCPVDRVVVLAAQPVVPDPGRMRHRVVDTRAGEQIRPSRPRLPPAWRRYIGHGRPLQFRVANAGARNSAIITEERLPSWIAEPYQPGIPDDRELPGLNGPETPAAPGVSAAHGLPGPRPGPPAAGPGSRHVSASARAGPGQMSAAGRYDQEHA
jgi:hypothetical protein